MKSKRFTPFPVLTSGRFVLRELRETDANEIYITRSDESVLRYLEIKKAENLEEAGKFIEKIKHSVINSECIYWAIAEKLDSKLVGTICLWNITETPSEADIGFVLLPQYQGKGIMQDIIPLVLNYGFNIMNLETINGEVDPRNIKSIKLMEKFEFTLKSSSENTMIYSLLKRDFISANTN